MVKQEKDFTDNLHKLRFGTKKKAELNEEARIKTQKFWNN